MTESKLSLHAAEAVLAALAEATRLRLLGLCAAGEYCVGELAELLGQSEPRVSRHLKILAEAELVERRREGHRVLYRAARQGVAAGLLQAALARLDPSDAALQRDAVRRERLGRDQPPAAQVRETRLGRGLRELVLREAPRAARGATALVGFAHPELLDAVCRLGARATAIVENPALARAARSRIELQALDCEVLVRPTPGVVFHSLVLDRAAGAATPLDLALVQARTLLAPEGRLWLLERYDTLEEAGQRSAEHPLARLRRLLADAGYECQRIRPLEADGSHILVTSAQLAPSRVHAA
jgi:DNA-binding transcriptional ArsR family regulator